MAIAFSLSRGTLSTLQCNVRGGIFFASMRFQSSSSKSLKEDVLKVAKDEDGVTVLTMNNPSKLNAWNEAMLGRLEEEFAAAAKDDKTKGLILTGTGEYYCCGVELSALMKPQHPQKLFDAIVKKNEGLFRLFLDFPKPLVCAVNGHAIGAPVTSATLADAIIAAENATFTTPFARLGVMPEGCSSVHFAKIMGEKTAERMLGKEGWKPTAAEAKEAGIVTEVVPLEQLLPASKNYVKELLKRPPGNQKKLTEAQLEQYRKVNREESVQLANAFFAVPFLRNQENFLRSKGKAKQANFFKYLIWTRPLWNLLLTKQK